MNKTLHYLGLDVHKETIAVSIAPAGRTEVRRYGIIPGTLAAVDKLVKKLAAPGVELRVVYEAGPCGFVLCRHLRAQGIACEVVARAPWEVGVGRVGNSRARPSLRLVAQWQPGGVSRWQRHLHVANRSCGRPPGERSGRWGSPRRRGDAARENQEREHLHPRAAHSPIAGTDTFTAHLSTNDQAHAQPPARDMNCNDDVRVS